MGRILKYLIIFSILISATYSLACSMFVININGKVLVGNNEDFWNPNSRIWFEKGDENNFGAAYVGFDDLWPQGAINEKGLVFDGFAMPYLEIKNHEGKTSPEREDFFRMIMQNCSNVKEVYEIISDWDLRGLETGMLYFVDKSGKQLIVEGDHMEIMNKDYDIISNFYPSQYTDLNEVSLEYYQKGRKFMESKLDTSLSYAASLLNELHQETGWGGGTLYSTIYDLNERNIYLYYNHDFENAIRFNLEEELNKGNKVLKIPELFPENTEAQEFLKNYNLTVSLIDSLAKKPITDTLTIHRIEQYLNSGPTANIFSENFAIAAQQRSEQKDYESAIRIYKLVLNFYPGEYQNYYKLAEAQLELKKYTEALKNFRKCARYIPDNKKLQEKIKTTEQLIDSK